MIFDTDNLKEITATLARNKTRTFLTAFGIFWGTAMLALLWGSSQGLQGLLRMNFDGFASNSGIIFPQRTTLPYHGYQKGMSWQLTTEDVECIRKAVPEIRTVSPIVSKSVTAKYRDRTFTGTIQGYEPSYKDVMTPQILKGRFISEKDLAQKSKVCVIGENVASTLFGEADPIGRYVEADNVHYRVVGIIKQRNEISLNGRLDDALVIPLTTVQSTYNIGKYIHFIAFVVNDGYTPTQLRPKIYRAIRTHHPLHPDDDDSMFFMDISEMFQMVDNVFSGVDVLVLFVGLSSLIAGIIGIGNIMWIIVKERTKEFGIRRALGAKPRAIMSQILAESAILTLIAGMAGICFAVALLHITTQLVSQSSGFDSDFQLTFIGAVSIMLTFLVLGTAAGAIPALKAMRIKPIEALNDK